MRMTGKLPIGLAASAMLAACGGSDDTTTVTTEGGTAEYGVDDDSGDAEIRFTDNDGQETVVTTGSGTDVAWPDGFTLYPGATVESDISMSGAEGQGGMITISSSDPAADVIEHYRAEAEAAGIEIQMEMRTGDTLVIGGESPEGRAFSVNATTENGETTAMIMAGTR